MNGGAQLKQVSIYAAKLNLHGHIDPALFLRGRVLLGDDVDGADG